MWQPTTRGHEVKRRETAEIRNSAILYAHDEDRVVVLHRWNSGENIRATARMLDAVLPASGVLVFRRL
ncbi:hypothetical protein ACS4RS_024815 [Rhizobium sp. F40D2]